MCSAMEKALEKVFDQFLVKNGITDVTHSDMVAHSVCDEFEVWQVLGWKVLLEGSCGNRSTCIN